MAPAPALQVGLKVGLDMSLALPVPCPSAWVLGALAAGSPWLLWQVALTLWASHQLAISLSASAGHRDSTGDLPVSLEELHESI